MHFQWYPGHMTKAKRMMQENIKLIDLIIEITDARIPLSSRNPDIDELGKNKFRLILLNKSDLADPVQNKKWTAFFEEKGYAVLEINAKTGAGMRSIQDTIRAVCKEKIERDKKRGIVNRPIRAMVVGIPNVGKSTFINSFAKKACAKTGNKPGVTKGKQWIKVNPTLELLDTPGILWPKFEDQSVGMKLAFIGSINDEILIMQEMAVDLLMFLDREYPKLLEERYGFTYAELEAESEATEKGQDAHPELTEEKNTAIACLAQIARVRKCFDKGEALNYDKAAALLIDDFRSGRIGRITLEYPAEEGKHES